jgi:hypothetical protein
VIKGPFSLRLSQTLSNDTGWRDALLDQKLIENGMNSSKPAAA